MDPKLLTKLEPDRLQREEVFPAQEKETSPISTDSDRPAVLVFTELIEESTATDASAVFIP